MICIKCGQDSGRYLYCKKHYVKNETCPLCKDKGRVSSLELIKTKDNEKLMACYNCSYCEDT